MNVCIKSLSGKFLCLAIGAGLLPGVAAQPVEEVVVTGSYIKRKSQSDSASPIQVIGSESLSETGAITFADFIPTLTINAGDEGRSDNFSGPRTQGTSNINLRGLGIGSNLVLLNGRRQTQAAMTNNDGESFVDTASLVPTIAVERVEILKDGAASLYGTDAISGVVNFITRDDFEGLDVEFNYQLVPDGNQDEFELGAIWGGGNEQTHFMVAFNVLERDSLAITERNLEGQQRGNPAGVSSSGFGFPGNFVTSGGLVGDPDCDAIAAQDSDGSALGSAVVFGNLQCRWDFHSFLDIVPDESRLSGISTLTHQFGDVGAMRNVEFRGELGFAHNKASRNTSPSFGPFSQPVSVPAAHPQNPFGEDVTFLGRVVGTDAPATRTKAKNDTWRGVGVLTGDFAETWSFEAGATWSLNEAQYRQPDTIIDDWQDAINNFSYNPFGNSLLVGPGDPAFNDPALLAILQDDLTLDAESSLWTFDAHVTGDLFDMPAGPVGVAVGVQYRHESLDYDYDPISNRDGYGFFIGNPDFKGDRNTKAVFVEFAIPLLENLDVQVAVRHEDYSGAIGSTTDPKVAVIWQPVDWFSGRGSFSTSFRAPSLFQTDGIGTTGSSGVFALGSFQFPAVRFRSDPNDPLEPETADVFNVGFSVEPIEDLKIDVDYWRFEYTDLIIREGEGALINAALAGDPQALTQVDFNLATGVLGQIRSFYRNAQSLDTDGIDVAVRYSKDTNYGQFVLTGNMTWVNEYDFNIGGTIVKGAGFLNAGTIGSPSPEIKANIGLNWSRNRHAANVFVRYIDSYVDQRNNRAGFDKLEAHATVDAQYSFQLFENSAVVFGARNIFDNDIPTVRDFIGYDSKTHDARQRTLYLRLNHSF